MAGRVIVYGTDFSETSTRALEAASVLARRLEATLVIAHAHLSPPPDWASS